MARSGLEKGRRQGRKWHEPGSKIERTRYENGTNQARTKHEPGSKMAQTRPENGASQVRKIQEPGSKPVRKILQFVSLWLEAGHAKWLKLRHDRRIDVAQMTGNSVRKAEIT